MEALANKHCRIGENPLWDPAHECVYWTDIPEGRIYKYEIRSGQTATVYDGQPVAGFTQEADGTLLLFRSHDIARLFPDGHVKIVMEFPHDGADRFNDVIADPEGRVFAGRFASTAEHGGLYRIDTDGSVHRLFTGCACPNGMGFSPDLQSFYFTCSPSRTIFGFDYDRSTGAITNKRPLYRAPDEEGIPDGLTVDEEGNLWSARWDGKAVIRHSPSGEVLEKIAAPVDKVSSVAFGGLQMNTLFVTTAGGDPAAGGEEGTLYSLTAETRGRVEFRSRILLA